MVQLAPFKWYVAIGAKRFAQYSSDKHSPSRSEIIESSFTKIVHTLLACYCRASAAGKQILVPRYRPEKHSNLKNIATNNHVPVRLLSPRKSYRDTLACSAEKQSHRRR